MRFLKQSHSAEKLERGDPLGFLKLQFAAKYQKNLKGGPFGDKKIRKKVAQCRKKLKDRHSTEKKLFEKVSG